MTASDRLCIVCVSDLFWDEHWSSEQQLMCRFAKRRPVLYVERPVSMFSYVTGISNASVSRQLWRWFKGGLRIEAENLFVLTPPPFLPFRYKRLVNKINQWIRIKSIRRAIRKLGFSKAVLWIYEPDAAATIGKLEESLSIYYCADDWGSSSEWWNRSKDVRRQETELAKKADLVIATSRNLAQRWCSVNSNTFFVPNAADIDLFRLARDADFTVSDEVACLPSPRIGYVGVVNARFDVGLYERLAELKPDWQWFIVGPVMDKLVDVACLRRKPNVHFVGPRPRSSLPHYLKGFDVCTVPYVCNKHSESIFPLKLFEYLAAGVSKCIRFG